MAILFGVSPVFLLCFDDFEELTAPTPADDNLLIGCIQVRYGKYAVKMLQQFLALNEFGQSRLLETAEDLTYIKKYSK